MFTDHMLFSGANELFWVLVTLYSFATRIRVPGLNPILLHPTPSPWAFPNIFFSRCAIAACILRAVSDRRYVAEKRIQACSRRGVKRPQIGRRKHHAELFPL